MPTNGSGSVCLEQLVQPAVHHSLQVDEPQQNLRPVRLLGELLQLPDQPAGQLALLQVTVVRLSLILSVRRVRTADQAGQDLVADPLLQPQQGLGEVSQLVEAADLLVDPLQPE